MNHLTEEQFWLVIDDKPGAPSDYMNHLEACDICKEHYKSLVQVHNGLDNLEYHQPSLRFAKNIYDLLAQKEALKKSERYWIRALQIAFYVGSTTVVVSLCWWFSQTTWVTTSFGFLDNILFSGAIWVIFGSLTLWLLVMLDFWLGHRTGHKTGLNIPREGIKN